MRFVPAVRTCLFEKYADFEGRASRSEFWWFDILLTGLYALSFLALRRWALAGAVVLVLLTTLIPYVAAMVRRLHDSGRSGLWLLLLLVPYVGVIVTVFLLIRGSWGEMSTVRIR
jgi:uncharacterized membrane protein YhaH (DUF805 family)